MAGLIGGAKVLDRAERLHRSRDVCDHGAEGRVADGVARALDEHDLRLRVGLEARGAEQVVGLASLAGIGVVHVDLLGADHLAEGHGGNDEREPTEDRGLPVGCAPATHPGREVVRLLQR